MRPQLPDGNNSSVWFFLVLIVSLHIKRHTARNPDFQLSFAIKDNITADIKSQNLHKLALANTYIASLALFGIPLKHTQKNRK